MKHSKDSETTGTKSMDQSNTPSKMLGIIPTRNGDDWYSKKTSVQSMQQTASWQSHMEGPKLHLVAVGKSDMPTVSEKKWLSLKWMKDHNL